MPNFLQNHVLPKSPENESSIVSETHTGTVFSSIAFDNRPIEFEKIIEALGVKVLS